MRVRDWFKPFLPPLVLSGYRWLRGSSSRERPEWEYVPGGWRVAEIDPRVKGWNVADVVAAQQMGRNRFVERANSSRPFDVSPEATNASASDLVFHNTVMCYAYVLALASRRKAAISMLDWGGGLGYYYLIGQRLIPELQVDYHCKEVEVLASQARVLWPDAHFYTDQSCLGRQYDMVLASCSIHYSDNWGSVLTDLARATAGYLFVTRLPTVLETPSFVFVQRPYAYGYNTEYIGWCLNRQDFLREATAAGLCLIREFVTGERPIIAGAPEQCEYRGFLFRPSAEMENKPM